MAKRAETKVENRNPPVRPARGKRDHVGRYRPETMGQSGMTGVPEGTPRTPRDQAFAGEVGRATRGRSTSEFRTSVPPISPAGQRPPLLVAALIRGEFAQAELRRGARVQAKFFGLPDGWHAIIADVSYLGPFSGLREAATSAIRALDAAGGMASTRGSVLCCKPGDLAFRRGDIVHGKVLRR